MQKWTSLSLLNRNPDAVSQRIATLDAINEELDL